MISMTFPVCGTFIGNALDIYSHCLDILSEDATLLLLRGHLAERQQTILDYKYRGYNILLVNYTHPKIIMTDFLKPDQTFKTPQFCEVKQHLDYCQSTAYKIVRCFLQN